MSLVPVIVTIIKDNRPIVATFPKEAITDELGWFLLPLSEILLAVGYERELSQGVRIEYFKDGEWREYYSTGIFDKARARDQREVVESFIDRMDGVVKAANRKK